MTHVHIDVELNYCFFLEAPDVVEHIFVQIPPPTLSHPTMLLNNH